MIKNSVKYKSFMEVVLERTTRDENNCWNWTGGLSKFGYGVVSWHRKDNYAHRLSYEDFYGDIDSNLTIDHVCRNRKCVNPTHLEQTTRTENVLRGVGVCAKNLKKTHCKNGHEFTNENTVIEQGNRRCRKCKNSYRLKMYYESRNI